MPKKLYKFNRYFRSNLGYTDDEIEYIFAKTNGRCRHCQKQLAYDNYGDRNARGGWEVDHSVPKSKGGTDHMRNLWPLCWICNMQKLDTHGHHHDKKYEPRSTGGKIVEFFGGRAGDLGTDPRRDFHG
jgi:5-methylcytosine-specific restriction endonuclease McrA